LQNCRRNKSFYKEVTAISNSKIVLFSISALALLLSGAHNPSVGGRYERWIKAFVERYPIPLDKNETVFDWWPLKGNLEYKYKITKSRWKFGEKWVDKQFTLRLIQDEQNENDFHFHIGGFDEFPYKGLLIRENRIFILSEHVEQPLIIFPLFKDMLFANEKYEYEFLKKAVLNSSEKLFYAPVSTEFWTVTEIVGNIYFLRQAYPRGASYKFEKNVGIIEWRIPGGYTIELIRPEPSS